LVIVPFAFFVSAQIYLEMLSLALFFQSNN